MRSAEAGGWLNLLKHNSAQAARYTMAGARGQRLLADADARQAERAR
eukprot:SAG31_NODE_1522_length_8012_cov_6.903336_1_plen_47_part_00